MSKKYYVLLISLAVFLIVSIVTIGVLTSNLVKKKEDDRYYQIGEIKIETIKEVTNADVELLGYNYTNDSGIVFTKTYKYKIDNVLQVLTDYNEYLMYDKEFEEVVSFDMSKEVAEYSLTKLMENNDSCSVKINYTKSTIQLEISYTYIEN